jgi:hypothetical protein
VLASPRFAINWGSWTVVRIPWGASQTTCTAFTARLAVADRLGHRPAVNAGHGQTVIEEHHVEAALFEDAADLW